MDALLRKRLEMAIRVRDLLRAHNTDAVGEGLGLGRLEQLIERAQVLAARQRAEFRLARGGSQEAFVMTVRGMLEKAIAEQEELVKQGMPASLLDDLAAALGEFEKQLDASRAERREHVRVIDDLIAVGEQIDEQIRVLDRLVRFRFSDNAELLAAWALIVRRSMEPSKELRQVEFA